MNVESNRNDLHLGTILHHQGAQPNQTGATFGRKTTRLDVGNLGDKSLLIAARVISNKPSLTDKVIDLFHRQLNYVKVVDGNQTILLKINSLCNRLGLTQQEVQEAASKGRLNTLITDQAKIVKYTRDITRTNSQIDPETVSRVIKLAQPSLNTSSATLVSDKHANRERYLVRKFEQQDGRTNLEIYKLSQLLGAGSFGEVFETQPLHESFPDKTVLKFAKTEDPNAQSLAAQDVRNEVRLLKEIHQNGNVCGIQSKPHKVVELGHPDQVAILGTKYECDYFTAINQSGLRNSYLETFQLLAGLKALSDKQIIHRDLKPGNILFKYGEGRLPIVHIADFGGAKKVGEEKSSSMTALYTPASDLYNIDNYKALARKCPLLKGEIDKIVNQLEQKIDVFALGCCIYQAFKTETPFKPIQREASDPFSSYNGYPDMSTYPSPLDPPEINALVQRMLDYNPSNRPSPEEAFREYERILQNSTNPTLQFAREKIETAIKPLYPGSFDGNNALPAYSQPMIQPSSQLSILIEKHSNLVADRKEALQAYEAFKAQRERDSEEGIEIIKPLEGFYRVWPSANNLGAIGVFLVNAHQVTKQLLYNPNEEDEPFDKWLAKAYHERLPIR